MRQPILVSKHIFPQPGYPMGQHPSLDYNPSKHYLGAIYLAAPRIDLRPGILRGQKPQE